MGRRFRDPLFENQHFVIITGGAVGEANFVSGAYRLHKRPSRCERGGEDLFLVEEGRRAQANKGSKKAAC